MYIHFTSISQIIADDQQKLDKYADYRRSPINQAAPGHFSEVSVTTASSPSSSVSSSPPGLITTGTDATDNMPDDFLTSRSTEHQNFRKGTNLSKYK